MSDTIRLPRVTGLYRYPVKGLSPQPADTLDVTVAAGLEGDRRFALALGTTRFDPAAPQPLDKGYFLMLRKNDSLAALRTRFDFSSQILSIIAPGGDDIEADTATPEGRAAIERFMLGYVGDACRGEPRLVEAPGHKFTDASVVSPAMMRAVSVINLASVRDLGQRLGRELNPLRFRANIYVDGLDPFAEFAWLGHDVTIGSARFTCVKRTQRCAAVDVDPVTAARDTRLPKALVQNYGHADLGVYLEVRGDGRLTQDDTVVTR